MGKTYEYEEYSYRRPRRDEDSDSEYESTIRPRRDHSSRPRRDSSSSRGGPRSTARVEEDTFVREEMHLAPPVRTDGRSRSVPPEAQGMELTRAAGPPSSYHSSNRSQTALAYPYDSDEDERARSRSMLRARDRSESPISRARSAVQDNFTNSTTGIGASLLGAVVGGYAAREASSAAQRMHRQKSGKGRRHSDKEQETEDRIRMLSTLVGAVAGGLGANALTNKFEDGRSKSKDEQRDWEKRHGREEDLPHYDDGRGRDRDYSRDSRDRRSRRYDEDEEEYDFVYDRKSAPRREASDAGYR